MPEEKLKEVVGKWEIIEHIGNELVLARRDIYNLNLMLRTSSNGIFDNIEFKFFIPKPYGEDELFYMLLSSSKDLGIVEMPFIRVNGVSVAPEMKRVKYVDGKYLIGIDRSFLRNHAFAETFLPLDPSRLIEISSEGIMVEGFKRPIKYHDLMSGEK
ncbi:MAG: hypothetical protein ACP5HW_03140 [Candidatus Micrarchaeia archaeon]